MSQKNGAVIRVVRQSPNVQAAEHHDYDRYVALNEGYATASTDTGHVNDGTQGRFAVGHPEKLTDFMATE